MSNTARLVNIYANIIGNLLLQCLTNTAGDATPMLAEKLSGLWFGRTFKELFDEGVRLVTLRDSISLCWL